MLNGAKDCVPFPAPLSGAHQPASASLRNSASNNEILDDAEHFQHNRKASVAWLRSAFDLTRNHCSPSSRNGVHLWRNTQYACLLLYPLPEGVCHKARPNNPGTTHSIWVGLGPNVRQTVKAPRLAVLSRRQTEHELLPHCFRQRLAAIEQLVAAQTDLMVFGGTQGMSGRS